jgi:iron complex transport system permease protein
MMKRNDYPLLLIGSIVVCLIVALVSLMLGVIHFTPGELFRYLFSETDAPEANILFYARLPRTLAALLSGAALALAGGVLQNVLANQLASPNVIGVNAGAGFGVTLCYAFGFVSGWAMSAFAFFGSLLSVICISLFAKSISASKSTVILGGIALNSILNALSESVAVLDPDVAMLKSEFRVGGFSSVSYTRLLPAACMIFLAMLLLFTLFHELDVVSLGDETAVGLGLSAKKYRALFLILAALLAGAAVSFAGLLGFVGLLVPHFVRKLTGNESKKFLPMTAVTGAGFVCLCDTITRVIFAPYELPVGIPMAILGAPCFVVLLMQTKGRKRICSK